MEIKIDKPKYESFNNNNLNLINNFFRKFFYKKNILRIENKFVFDTETYKNKLNTEIYTEICKNYELNYKYLSSINIFNSPIIFPIKTKTYNENIKIFYNGLSGYTYGSDDPAELILSFNIFNFLQNLNIQPEKIIFLGAGKGGPHEYSILENFKDKKLNPKYYYNDLTSLYLDDFKNRTGIKSLNLSIGDIFSFKEKEKEHKNNFYDIATAFNLLHFYTDRFIYTKNLEEDFRTNNFILNQIPKIVKKGGYFICGQNLLFFINPYKEEKKKNLIIKNKNLNSLSIDEEKSLNKYSLIKNFLLENKKENYKESFNKDNNNLPQNISILYPSDLFKKNDIEKIKKIYSSIEFIITGDSFYIFKKKIETKNYSNNNEDLNKLYEDLTENVLITIINSLKSCEKINNFIESNKISSSFSFQPFESDSSINDGFASYVLSKLNSSNEKNYEKRKHFGIIYIFKLN